MSSIELSPKQELALVRQQRRYQEAKAELIALDFVLQGSVTERWIKCGKVACSCRQDPQARHGPYYQWSWKSGGRTASVYLTKEQATLCRQWVKNNRQIEKIIKRLRKISLTAARLYEIPSK